MLLHPWFSTMVVEAAVPAARKTSQHCCLGAFSGKKRMDLEGQMPLHLTDILSGHKMC